MNSATLNLSTRNRSKPLRVGFVPLSDCAPLVMAQELGLFERYQVAVELRREVGWATIRQKIVYGELDAAHALGPMPFAATFGLGTIPCDCICGLVLSLQGNAITLSQELWKKGVHDGRTLREEIVRMRGKKVLIFGVVFPLSSHTFLLRQWLAASGIDPDRDVRIVVVPPPLMLSNLKSGNLDGYCVGEPWNLLAVEAGVGACAAISSQLASHHPEKVLLVRREFADSRPEEHLRLMAALLEACAYCDLPEHAPFIASTLSSPKFVNIHADCLQRSLLGPFEFGHQRRSHSDDGIIFHRHGANEPSPEKAAWIINQLFRGNLLKDHFLAPPAHAWNIFRPDLFSQAKQLLDSHKTHETIIHQA